MLTKLVKDKSPLPFLQVTVTICGDACPLSCVSAEAYKLAQCTRLQVTLVTKLF